MKTALRGIVYFALLGLIFFFFGRFRVAYNAEDRRAAALDAIDAVATNELAADAVGTAAAPTNSPVTAGSSTNLEATATNGLAVAASTTPLSGGTNGAATKSPAAAPRKSQAGGYLAGFVLGILALAGFAGWDVTQWFAGRAARGIGADAEPIDGDPEYDAAEAEWANGNHIEAITLMRSYLEKHPSEQHVAIRIAEIYEKDLNNYLAALELEEVLDHRLGREKWGWTAIHLANLYSGRLNQPPKAIATLERIVEHYPETAAARKARQRLGLPEPTGVGAPETAADGESAGAAADVPEAEPEDPHLPQGFRSKKR